MVRRSRHTEKQLLHVEVQHGGLSVVRPNGGSDTRQGAMACMIQRTQGARR
jgi:hypothetical protein